MNKKVKGGAIANIIGRFPLIGTPGTLPKTSDFLKRRRKIAGLMGAIKAKKGGLIKK